MTKKEPPWMTDEHVMFGESVRRFLADELVPCVDRWRAQGHVDVDFWRRAGDAGLLGVSIPEAYGGAGGDQGHDLVIVLEHARTGDSGWGYGVHSIVIHYLLTYGSEEQKKRWLPRLATGELIGAIAMTEPGTGSDLQAVRTTAVRGDCSYEVNGTKTFVTNGMIGNFIVVVAKTDRSEGAKGISLIGVETEGLEGFSRGRNLEKLGQKAQDTSELAFEGAAVPKDNLIGTEEGQGFYQLMEQLGYERLMVGVGALGAAELAVHETVSYVQQRRAFGKRIMDFQNTRFKLAECQTKLEVMRAFVDRGVGLLLAGELDVSTAAMIKWWSTDTVCDIVDECVQLHGGYGYIMEYPIAHLYADVRISRIYAGTNEIQKELIARALDGDGQ